MELEIGNILEERSSKTTLITGVHTIDKVTKNFAYAGKLKFTRKPKKTKWKSVRSAYHF